MPYPKTSMGYPVQMKELIKSVATDQQARVLTCSNERTARGLRAKFYQFLGATKRDVNSPGKLFLDDPARYKEIKDFLVLFLSVEFKLDGSKLIIRSKDNSPLSEVFDNAQLLEEEIRHVPADEQSGELSPAERSAAKLQKRLDEIAAAGAVAKKFTGEEGGGQ